MFVRGLNGAYVALAPGADISQQLYLEPTNQSADGSLRTARTALCRKCGQPYLVGFRFTENGQEVLRAFGATGEQRGEIMWFTWESPESRSEDEAEEAEGTPTKMELAAYDPKTGAFHMVPDVKQVKPAEVPLWRLAVKKERLSRCVACGGTGGGNGSVTPIRADSDAAQAAVADAFYRRLPPAVSPVARDYPGQGRKLLAFADGRQPGRLLRPLPGKY